MADVLLAALIVVPIWLALGVVYVATTRYCRRMVERVERDEDHA